MCGSRIESSKFLFFILLNWNFLLVCWSVCHDFLKGWEFTLPCANQSTLPVTWGAMKPIVFPSALMTPIRVPAKLLPISWKRRRIKLVVIRSFVSFTLILNKSKRTVFALSCGSCDRLSEETGWSNRCPQHLNLEGRKSRPSWKSLWTTYPF